MIRSNIVKTLLSISFFVCSIICAAEWSVLPNYDCGTYKVSGYFSKNAGQNFIITVRQGSSSPYELIVLGGEIPEKLDRANTEVNLLVYVPAPIKSNNKPLVFFQKFLDNNHKVNEFELVAKEKCGLKDKYK